MSIELVMPSNHLILHHLLLLLPSIFPSIRVFSNESVLLIRWPNYVCTNLITLASSSLKSSTIASWYEITLVHLALPPLISGEGNGNPLQYSCLENPRDRGAWWVAVHGVAQSRTQLKRLSMCTCIGEGNSNPLLYPCLENPRDRGAWWAAVYGVTQSQTWLKQLSSSNLWVDIFLSSR